MMRRARDTVEYFPHPVIGGKTLFILEERFGNDGYAFWYKLQELLGETEGHYYYCADRTNWRYLLAKTHVESKVAVSILDVLAEVGEIDQELWDKRVIWSETFVADLETVYKNRKRDLPQRPSIPTGGNNQGVLFYDRKDTGEAIPTSKKPQSKGKENKVEKNKKSMAVSDCISTEQFEKLWKAYPGTSEQKGSKKKAQEKITAKTFSHTFEEVKRSFRCYSELSENVKHGYIKHMTTFLNGGFVSQFLEIGEAMERERGPTVQILMCPEHRIPWDVPESNAGKAKCRDCGTVLKPINEVV